MPANPENPAPSVVASNRFAVPYAYPGDHARRRQSRRKISQIPHIPPAIPSSPVESLRSCQKSRHYEPSSSPSHLAKPLLPGPSTLSPERQSCGRAHHRRRLACQRRHSSQCHNPSTPPVAQLQEQESTSKRKWWPCGSHCQYFSLSFSFPTRRPSSPVAFSSVPSHCCARAASPLLLNRKTIATVRLPSLRHPRPHLNLCIGFCLFLALTLISPFAETLIPTLDFLTFAAHPLLIGASAFAPSPPRSASSTPIGTRRARRDQGYGSLSLRTLASSSSSEWGWQSSSLFASQLVFGSK
uniref:Uncharacterized protein n=1 Tax=Ananas comosus var. bracteatus TaxID=296719 RepID=A0A6V7PZW9_ANACO|nr:unnamed protein product [Ananas comosus var. bracteatus]